MGIVPVDAADIDVDEALYLFLTILVQLSCSSYGSTIEKEFES